MCFQRLINANRLLICLLALTVSTSVAFSCPFCGPSITLGEQIYGVDATALVERVGGTEAENGGFGTTRLKVVKVIHISEALAKAQFNLSDAVTKVAGAKIPVEGDEFSIPRYYPPKAGAKYLVRGIDPEKLVWGDRLIEISDEVLQYVLESPTVREKGIERTPYFLRFLEHENPEIAQDAYAEFSIMPYETVYEIRAQLPRDSLRNWLFDPEIPSTRLGLYGLMLGLCGDDTDAELLERRIHQDVKQFENGIDGVIGGYLLLTGDRGMEQIEKTILNDRQAKVGLVLASMQAMRFLWTYGEMKISHDRLRDGMLQLADHPDVLDLAIRDLSRWKDWRVLDQLVENYGQPGYDDPVRRDAIARYVIACTKDVRKAGDGKAERVETPEHVIKARRYLDELRKKDPKIVKRAEKFFFLR